MNNQFQLADVSQRALTLFHDSANTLRLAQNGTVSSLAAEVPTSFMDSSKPVSIVFAGQYSAGKSTIVSTLTGVKLRTGQGVTTDTTTHIDWNGMTVIDTPGIHTQKHPDHDAITYEAIAAADLIVFVLTNEGFSSHLGSHFRKLLYDMGKGHEMMMVVNKMEQEAMGNTPRTQTIKAQDINKVLQPDYSVNDLYTAFISAEIYSEALNADDEDERRELLDISGWDTFVANLNHFAKDKHLAGQYTTNLYKLEQILRDAIAQYKSEHPEADALIEQLNRNRRALYECRRNIKERCYAAIQQSGQEVIKLGDDMALSLDMSCTENDFNAQLKKAYDLTDKICENTAYALETIANEEAEKLNKAISVVNNSQLVCDLVQKILSEIETKDLTPKANDTLPKGADTIGKVGKWMDGFAKGKNAQGGWDALSKLSNYSGSQAHNWVLKIGHFCGHKFKPWEAVKIAGKIGKVGKFLGVAGAFAGVALQFWNDIQEDNAETELRDARADIRRNFRSAAYEIEKHFNESIDKLIIQEINPKIAEFDEHISDLEQLRHAEDAEHKALMQCLRRTRTLIADVQSIS